MICNCNEEVKVVTSCSWEGGTFYSLVQTHCTWLQ